ncbi:MAG: 4-(cytidine 5'-diphospho)-2-C-methyl-D-erythritol kinase [Chloroflexi bacterium]|nr:4-(cytidine 5'-diphospho)-2-C-methyl-D-erythritol kinase [Chloroflexota bacterium]
MPSTLTISAPAKINLTLEIQKKEKDGFHSLESIFLAVSLYDRLVFSASDSGNIKLAGNMKPLQDDEPNIIEKAAGILKKRTRTQKGANIKLTKKIPLGSGLGGGSSDAAATFAGLIELWGLKDGDFLCRHLGPVIGSDVPFFLKGGCALVRGRGEKVTSLPDVPRLYVVLAYPRMVVATWWAYDLVDRRKAASGESVHTAAMAQAVQNKDYDGIINNLHNDFEAPLLKEIPLLKDLKILMLESGLDGAMLSGSGSTIFGLAKTRKQAESAASKLKKADIADLYLVSPANGMVIERPAE